MAIFFMFGNYTAEARKETLPGIDDAIKASVALSDLTGIAFTTCPAVTVEAFDELVKSAG